ncbi:MAG TPA: Lrp/AsnC family transcriptional regulator [Gammaproteobacteria bacterium]|nr:Lrp/AsnC family transcriptional regulator [Gammaproteobacteria bacterium]
MEAMVEKLLNDFQRNFPLEPMPFEQIAQRLNTSSEQVLQTLKDLQKRGAVSRVGPVFQPNTVGASTLVAMSVAASQLDRVAAIINQFPQVNHNYEREHHYNLWFVVTAENVSALGTTLREIQLESGHRALSLPLVRNYHIDLGFHMNLDRQHDIAVVSDGCDEPEIHFEREMLLGDAEGLIEVIQAGLPLVARPYQAIANRLGYSEQAVIDKLRNMIDAGIIKRLGVVVRHHELGYHANAMVVWDVPGEQVDKLGHQLGQQDCVTLCYQRPRRLPDWPYNLFCMVHGRDRDDVLACIARMVDGLGLDVIPHTVLFSRKRFKQRGARYRGHLNG